MEIPHPIQSFYDPRALTVTTVTHLGIREVRQVLTLENYLARQERWPGYYPEFVIEVRRKEAVAS